MFETKKTNKIRNSVFYNNYIKNKRVIDIGAGLDPISTNADRFDINEGDANFILNYKIKNSYDTVYSSHCLEDMIDAKKSLSDWWTLVKPGGHLILIIPDEDLYEQGIWPSLFNWDHKHTFTLKQSKSWSPVSLNIENLVKQLPDSKIISAKIQDTNYNYNLQKKYPIPLLKMTFIFHLVQKIIKITPWSKIKTLLYIFLTKVLRPDLLLPKDQTRYGALAQIEIIAQKQTY
jgi:SAM-dependent methyltransferase